MMTMFKLAFRDLMRNRRRSFFSALALAIGLSLLLLMAGVVEDEMRHGMDTSIKLQSGHIQVRNINYDDVKNSLKWEDLIENPDQLAATIAEMPQVVAATPRIITSAIISIGDETSAVSVLGIEPDSPANDPFRKGVLSGQFLTADDRDGILIGYLLADRLGLKAGDPVDLVMNTANGDVDEQIFTIRGTYTTYTPGFDGAVVFMPLAKAQAITRVENRASVIFVLLHDITEVQPVVDALKTNQLQIKTYRELNQMMVTMEDLARGYMVLLYLIILGITATVIVNTLIMSVFERTREIGILSAIGMKARGIMGMFFAESCLLALGGIVMGVLLGMLWVYIMATKGVYVGNMGLTGMLLGDRIYATLTVKDAVNLSIMALIVTLVASLYPAWIASRMQPVEALHSGQ
jgi:ABC-type lipoprotein release transport system permease subunit